MKLYYVSWFDSNESDYRKSLFPTKAERDAFVREIRAEHEVLVTDEIEFSVNSRRALCDTLLNVLDIR